MKEKISETEMCAKFLYAMWKNELSPYDAMQIFDTLGYNGADLTEISELAEYLYPEMEDKS